MQLKKVVIRSLAFIALAMILNSDAFAGTATSNVAISATVNANCTISTTTNVAFGAYDPLVTNGSGGVDLTASGAVSVACTKNTTASITLDQGLHATGGSTCTAPARQLSDGTDSLAYSLWQNVGLTTAWGCTAGTNDMSYTAANKNAVSKTIYGKITKNQDVENGSYTDTVVATITF